MVSCRLSVGQGLGLCFQLFIRVFPFPSFDFRFPRSEPLSISRSPEALSLPLTTDNRPDLARSLGPLGCFFAPAAGAIGFRSPGF